MYNAHPYFSLKNMGGGVHIIHGKIQYQLKGKCSGCGVLASRRTFLSSRKHHAVLRCVCSQGGGSMMMKTVRTSFLVVTLSHLSSRSRISCLTQQMGVWDRAHIFRCTPPFSWVQKQNVLSRRTGWENAEVLCDMLTPELCLQPVCLW